MAFDFTALGGGFFDSAAVLKRVSAGKRRVFSRFGAFVRTRARSSIRSRKKSSPPGQPPSAHQGAIKLILFAWDAQRETVVVGPIPFTSKPGAKLLEHGGDTTRKGKRLHYAGNPFMRPALMAEQPKFVPMMKNLMR